MTKEVIIEKCMAFFTDEFEVDGSKISGDANLRIIDVRLNVYDYFTGHAPNAHPGGAAQPPCRRRRDALDELAVRSERLVPRRALAWKLARDPVGPLRRRSAQ